MVAEKTITEDKEALNRLIQKVIELFITYKTTEQLLHTDISVIGRTAKKNRGMKHPSFLDDYWTTWADIFRGKWTDRYLWNTSLEKMGRLTIHNQGGLSPWLLKRRIKRMVKDILSTCYLYIFFEKDSEKMELAQKIIAEIKKDETSTITKTRASNTDKLKLSLELLSILLGIVTIPVLSKLINQIPADFVIQYIAGGLLIFALEFPLIWLIPKLLWYRKVITICHVKAKEITIYDDLLLLQKNVSLFP